jgi:hypothetical protein
MWEVKKAPLFERTLPEARWSASKYQPEPPKRKKLTWRLKTSDSSAKLPA